VRERAREREREREREGEREGGMICGGIFSEAMAFFSSLWSYAKKSHTRVFCIFSRDLE
jgi:hypothetical protein